MSWYFDICRSKSNLFKKVYLIFKIGFYVFEGQGVGFFFSFFFGTIKTKKRGNIYYELTAKGMKNNIILNFACVTKCKMQGVWNKEKEKAGVKI